MNARWYTKGRTEFNGEPAWLFEVHPAGEEPFDQELTDLGLELMLGLGGYSSHHRVLVLTWTKDNWIQQTDEHVYIRTGNPLWLDQQE